MKSKLLFVVFLTLSLVGSSYAEEKAKVVFISGSPSHGRMHHEHRAAVVGNLMLVVPVQNGSLAIRFPHKDKQLHHFRLVAETSHIALWVDGVRIGTWRNLVPNGLSTLSSPGIESRGVEVALSELRLVPLS